MFPATKSGTTQATRSAPRTDSSVIIPFITGTAYPGETLTSTAAGQWTVNGVDQAETGSTYVQKYSDIGKTITQVGASNSIVTLGLASFSPAAWFDADDTATLFNATSGGSLPANGAAVARWEDKSGNLRHLTQATGVSQPTRRTSVQNTHDVIRFDGSNDSMAGASFLHGSTWSIFTVAKRTATPTELACVMYAGRGGSDPLCAEVAFYNIYQPTPSAYSGYGAKEVNGSPTLTLPASPTPFVITSAVGTANVNITSASKAMLVGAGYTNAGDVNWRLNGDIGEIFIVPGSVSNATRDIIINILNLKWGIF